MDNGRSLDDVKRDDPTDLDAQEAADARLSEVQRLRNRMDDEDFRFLMSNPQGRRFMWRLLSVTGLFLNPMAERREQTDFNCGRQVIGQTFWAELHRLCPEKYNLMVKEQRQHAAKIREYASNPSAASTS